MKSKYSYAPILVALFMSVFIVSCNDKWDSHYYATSSDKVDMTVMQYIKSDSSLTKFAQMLQVTGYDSLLNQPQSFTVWAPVNSSLTAIDPNSPSDSALVRKLVTNHITRFLYSTANLQSQKILMLDNKLITFAKVGSDATFGGKTIEKSDIAVNNGIVHIISDYVPYTRNLWEFLNEASGLDSVRDYVNSLTKLVFDASKSFKDGVLVDSVMKSQNYILTHLADLSSEDSLYTAIFPDNNAWKMEYDSIAPYYKCLDADGGAVKQRIYTDSVLVKDLFFRQKVSLPISADTLVSTLGTKFANPSRLFTDAQPTELSNGVAYVATQLNTTPKESWFKPIKMEAEYASLYGGETQNYNESVLSSLGTSEQDSISNKYYVAYTATTTSILSTLAVNFPIPNTLHAKYNVYCVFVPTSIVDTSDHRPYKIRFKLQYVDSVGKTVTGYAQADHTLGTSRTSFTTDPYKLDKMLVLKDFEFPYSNIIDYSNVNFKSNINVMLRVENAASSSADNRNFRIDCVILEPVSE